MQEYSAYILRKPVIVLNIVYINLIDCSLVVSNSFSCHKGFNGHMRKSIIECMEISSNAQLQLLKMAKLGPLIGI